MVARLRAERADEAFVISLRITCNEGNVDETRGALAAYREAGVQHVMAAPEDRDIETYLRTVERFWRAGVGV